MNVEEYDLSRLRRIIMKDQWKESYNFISSLFAKDVPCYTVFVADQMIRSCLRFRSHYDLEWVISLGQDVISLIQEGYEELDFPDEANGTFAAAPHGVASLIGGAIELWESVSVAHEDNEKSQHLAVALNRFIMAEQENYWETIHPDELKLRGLFWDAPTTANGKKILPTNVNKEKMYRGIGFLKQPESIGYHTARLLSIVDEIELILNQ